MDDFGVKFFKKEDVEHLCSVLKEYYEISTDWTGGDYCGLILEWNYKEGYVDILMPGYVVRALAKYQHPPPKKPQHAPHHWTKPVYGQKVQYAQQENQSKKLDSKGKQKIQSVAGTFLYYGRGVDNTILVALNDIGTQQATPTENTNKEVNWLMDYLHTHPNAKLRYCAGSMQLFVDSDAAYLVLPGSKRRFAGHFYLASNPNPKNYNKAPKTPLY